MKYLMTIKIMKAFRTVERVQQLFANIETSTHELLVWWPLWSEPPFYIPCRFWSCNPNRHLTSPSMAYTAVWKPWGRFLSFHTGRMKTCRKDCPYTGCNSCCSHAVHTPLIIEHKNSWIYSVCEHLSAKGNIHSTLTEDKHNNYKSTWIPKMANSNEKVMTLLLSASINNHGQLYFSRGFFNSLKDRPPESVTDGCIMQRSNTMG